MIFITFFVVSFLIFLQACAVPVQRRDNFVSVDDVMNYLSAHNEVRAMYDASPLTWSDDLAAGAQAWADGCNFAHSDGVLSNDAYGENIAAATGSFGVRDAVQSFLSDEDSYDPQSPTFSDFTQIVWKNTTSLGCAFNTQCNNIFPASAGSATIHVCLYNPPGNVVGLLSENVDVQSVLDV